MGTQTEGGAEVLRWVKALQRGRRVETNSRRIFEHYYGWVRGFFVRRQMPLERAEELAQEVFFQVFQRLPSFRHDSPFDSWLFAIAANLLRNERRRLATRKRDAPEVPISAHEATGGPEVEDPAESPEDAASRNQRLLALERAIGELPAKPRDCIRLRLAGYDYPEIAEVLRLAQSTARVHVFTARQRLRDALGAEYSPWIGTSDEARQ